MVVDYKLTAAAIIQLKAAKSGVGYPGHTAREKKGTAWVDNVVVQISVCLFAIMPGKSNGEYRL
jgi:hypothetical protein